MFALYHKPIANTNLPADTDALIATVIAPTSIQAERAAQICLLLGSRFGLDWLHFHPKLAGMLVQENGQCLYSRNFENIFGLKHMSSQRTPQILPGLFHHLVKFKPTSLKPWNSRVIIHGFHELTQKSGQSNIVGRPDF